MTCHRLAVVQTRSTPSPPVIVVDHPVSVLGSSDVKPLQTSFETKCLHCLKECQSLRGNMQIHSAKKVMTKPDEEPAGLMGASANVNGYHGHNVMLFSPVKRKRSKRGMPALDSEEMCAAATLLMLAEYSDKSSASENCCMGENNDNISTPNLLKEVNLNALDQLSQPYVLNNMRPKSDQNAAYEGFYDFSEKENNLNLAADVPKKMVLLNVFDDGLVDGDAEFMKPGADISVDEVNMELLNSCAGFTQPYAAGDGDVGGLRILAQPALNPTDGDGAGLQPPVPCPAGDTDGMGIFDELAPFCLIDDDNAGILQPGFGPIDDDDVGLHGQLGDNAGLRAPVPYPAGDAGPAPTAAADMEIEQQGLVILPYDIAGLLALAAGLGTPRLEENNAHQLRFAGLTSDQACLSMLRAFRRALDEEKQLHQCSDGQASLADEMDGPGPSDPVRRRGHGPSRARRARAQHVGARRGETSAPSRSAAGRRGGSRMPGQ